MFKYKKIFIVSIATIYTLLTISELVIYLGTDSNLYGLIYLFLSLIIIFFLIPAAYNYKRHYSIERISKLIIIVLLGIFSSYVLNIIILNSMPYKDSSYLMINKLFVIKNVVKPVLYGLILLFTIIESKVLLIFKKQ